MRMIRLGMGFFCSWLAWQLAAGAANQPGSLDATFNFNGQSGTVSTFAVQADGKILAGGWMPGSLLRLHPDGSIDNSFTASLDRVVHQILVLSNNQLIVLGAFTRADGISVPGIARLDSNGSLDAGFRPAVPHSGTVGHAALFPDNKVLITFSFTNVNGIAQWGFARLNPNGSLDGSFSAPAITSAISHVTTTLDGSILFSTIIPRANRYSDYPIARLGPNGELDTNFNTGTGGDFGITVLAAQADGKVVVGGEFTTFAGAPAAGLIRLQTNGSRDLTFQVPLQWKYVYSVDFQPDGKLVIGGSFTMSNGVSGVARLLPDGALDPSFAAPLSWQRVEEVKLQWDGRVLVAGLLNVSGKTKGPVRLLGDPFFIEAWHPVTDSIQFSGLPGRTYVLQGSSDLETWVSLATNTFFANPMVLADGTKPKPTLRFYRVQMLY